MTLEEFLDSTDLETLKDNYRDLLMRYTDIRDKYNELSFMSSWERTARQQERSGGWM